MRPRPVIAAVAALVVLLVLPGCGRSAAVGPADPPPAPGSGRWQQLPAGPLTPRHGAAGAWVAGLFVLVGGWAGQPCADGASCAAPVHPALRDGAAFDPVSRRWHSIAPAPVPVDAWLGPVVVRNRVYLLTSEQGRADSPVAFLRYDPRQDRWATLPPPPHDSPQLVAAGQRVVSLAYSDEHVKARDFVFDEPAGRWRRLPDDPLGPSFGRAATGLGDRLLLTAADLVPDPGADGPSLTRLAVLDASLRHWTRWPDSGLIGGSAIAVADRVVFPQTGSADGGEVGGWGRRYPYGGILDPATGRWRDLPQPPRGRGLDGFVLDVGDRTFVGGHLLDPRTGAWTRLQPLPGRERKGETVLSGAGTLFVWGGSSGLANLADGYTTVP